MPSHWVVDVECAAGSSVHHAALRPRRDRLQREQHVLEVGRVVRFVGVAGAGEVMGICTELTRALRRQTGSFSRQEVALRVMPGANGSSAIQPRLTHRIDVQMSTD